MKEYMIFDSCGTRAVILPEKGANRRYRMRLYSELFLRDGKHF